MFRRSAVLAVAAVMLASFPAWADIFPTAGLDNLSNDRKVINAGIMPRLKSASLDFENKLNETLLAAGANDAKWAELVKGALEKGAEAYNLKVYEAFLKAKTWSEGAKSFLDAWNYGGLELADDVKGKINTITESHFKELGSLLRGLMYMR